MHTMPPRGRALLQGIQLSSRSSQVAITASILCYNLAYTMLCPKIELDFVFPKPYSAFESRKGRLDEMRFCKEHIPFRSATEFSGMTEMQGMQLAAASACRLGLEGQCHLSLGACSRGPPGL